jgi:hypothetical protein
MNKKLVSLGILLLLGLMLSGCDGDWDDHHYWR